jgi:hypothetical protein
MNKKERNIKINQILQDLNTLLKNTKSPNLIYAIKENILFFKAIKSYLSYLLWLFFRAPFIDKNKILELADLGLEKYSRELLEVLTRNELKFSHMIEPLVDSIVELILSKNIKTILDLGSGGMTIEYKIIKKLKEINYKKRIVLIGIDSDPQAHELAKTILSEFDLDILETSNLSSQFLEKILNNHQSKNISIVFSRENIFRLDNVFPDNFVDLVFHSKFKHHLNNRDKEKLDSILLKIAKIVIEYDNYRKWRELIFRPRLIWGEPVLLNGAILSRVRGFTKSEIFKKYRNLKVNFYFPDYYLLFLKNSV